MSPLKRKIEDRSITALQSVIDAHPTMEGYINKKDKELSWDGYIRLYLNGDSEDDKSNYDDDIPVQIKGHVDRARKFMDQERIKVPVSLSDLNVYYRKFGCLYFVVYMNEEGSESEIFYSSLYPSKIKEYLEEAAQKGNKGTISIPFLKLEKVSKTLYLLCKQFSFEIRKQGSGLGQIVPKAIADNKLQQVKRITATTIGGKTVYDLLQRISTGDAVIYGTVDDSGIQYPMQLRQMVATVKQTMNIPVYVGGKQYYSSFKMESTVTSPDVPQFNREGTHILTLSNNLVLAFKEAKCGFRFQFNSDIMQLKKDAEFLLDLLEKQELTVRDQSMPFGDPDVEKGLLDELNGIIEAGQALEDIGCNILIPFRELTDEDRGQIDILAGIKAGKIHFDTDQSVFMYTWTFRNKFWPIVVDASGSGVKIYGYIFNTRFVFSLGSPADKAATENLPDDAYIVPNFLRTQPELLANLYNYDYESMYEQIDRTVINEHTRDELNYLALNLISTFDICGNEKLLDVGAELLRRLIDIYPDAVHYTVNLGQIEVRKHGQLSEASTERLAAFMDLRAASAVDNKDHIERRLLSYCVAVLNQKLDQADELYMELTSEDKESVDGWPIRTLHIRMRD